MHLSLCRMHSGVSGSQVCQKMQTAGTAHQLLELPCVVAPRGLQHAAEVCRALLLDMPAEGVAAQANSGVRIREPELPCASKWNVGQVQLQWSALTVHAHVCQYLLWHDLGSSGQSSGADRGSPRHALTAVAGAAAVRRARRVTQFLLLQDPAAFRRRQTFEVGLQGKNQTMKHHLGVTHVSSRTCATGGAQSRSRHQCIPSEVRSRTCSRINCPPVGQQLSPETVPLVLGAGPAGF